MSRGGPSFEKRPAPALQLATEPSLTFYQVDDDGVVGTAGNVSHGHHVMTSIAQGPHHDEVAAFVRQELHPGLRRIDSLGRGEEYLFMSERVGRVGESSADVWPRQVRVGSKQVFLRRSLAQ